jgi:HSP20 family protein
MAYSVGFYNPCFTSDVFDVIERNFSNYFGKNDGLGAFPAVDVKETPAAYTLDVDLPGIKEDNVDVNLEEQVLTITAKREESVEEGLKDAKEEGAEEKAAGLKWLVRERKTGSFIRRFSLPADVDAHNIKADFEHGVLTVTVPRKAKDQGHRIAITPRG